MKNDIESLKEEFFRIKDMGFVRSMRKGSTGIGYTFETLIHKEEDQECKPDYGSIEIKCKSKHSKYPLKLFTMAPQRNEKFITAYRYVFDRYSHHKYNRRNGNWFLNFEVNAIERTKSGDFEFQLKLDYYGKEIVLQSFYNGMFLENVCYWSFDILETKLKTKLQTMALIHGVTEDKDGEKYYKYIEMHIYKLRGFLEFLNLLNKGDIFIGCHIEEKDASDNTKYLDNHGFYFCIGEKAIPKLFKSIRY